MNKMIWKNKASIEDLNRLSKNSMIDHLGIEFAEIGKDYISASMPVDNRTLQPMRILHGGASAALAETLGSVASYLLIDQNNMRAVGMNIETHHVSSVATGRVKGVAKPLHVGRQTHLWDIKIYDDKDKLISVSLLKVMTIPKSQEK